MYELYWDVSETTSEGVPNGEKMPRRSLSLSLSLAPLEEGDDDLILDQLSS